jgi:hypothetical protein
MVGENALIELKCLLNFIIIKFGEIIDFDEIVIVLIIFAFSLVYIKERFDRDSFFGCY